MTGTLTGISEQLAVQTAQLANLTASTASNATSSLSNIAPLIAIGGVAVLGIMMLNK